MHSTRPAPYQPSSSWCGLTRPERGSMARPKSLCAARSAWGVGPWLRRAADGMSSPRSQQRQRRPLVDPRPAKLGPARGGHPPRSHSSSDLVPGPQTPMLAPLQAESICQHTHLTSTSGRPRRSDLVPWAAGRRLITACSHLRSGSAARAWASAVAAHAYSRSLLAGHCQALRRRVAARCALTNGGGDWARVATDDDGHADAVGMPWPQPG